LSPIRAICLVYLILLDLIILIVSGEGYKNLIVTFQFYMYSKCPLLSVVSIILCVVLCAVFRLIVVLFWCVICLLCLIVKPLPPGKNPFAVNQHYITEYLLLGCSTVWFRFLPTFRRNVSPPSSGQVESTGSQFSTYCSTC
jgi:hypothetical protein